MAEVAASTCLTLREIENELSEVTGADWYPLGVQLGLRPPTLREIQKNYPLDTEQCKREMLDIWLHSTPKVSWKSLAQAVQALGRYESLAQKLRRKVPPAPKGELSSITSGKREKGTSTESRHSVEEQSAPTVNPPGLPGYSAGVAPPSGVLQPCGYQSPLLHGGVEHQPTFTPPPLVHQGFPPPSGTQQPGGYQIPPQHLYSRGGGHWPSSNPSLLPQQGLSPPFGMLHVHPGGYQYPPPQHLYSGVGGHQPSSTPPQLQQGFAPHSGMLHTSGYRISPPQHFYSGYQPTFMPSQPSQQGFAVLHENLFQDSGDGGYQQLYAQRELQQLRESIKGNNVDSFHRHLNELERVVQNNERMGQLLEEDGLLCLAASLGSNPVVETLIQKGIDINAMSGVPEYPNFLCRFREVCNFLTNPTLGLPCTGQLTGHVDTVKYLVEKGANLHSKDDQFGDSPLHLAARGGHTDTVHYLSDKGAGINITNNIGTSPLHWAADGGHVSTVKFLVEKGAKVNIKDVEGDTPLHTAAVNGHTDTVHYLTDNGAGINITNNIGKTPLHWAADVDTVKLLVEKGADINVKERNGWTALHLAAYNGHVKTAQLLVEEGADMNVETSNGRTPLDVAARRGHKEVVAYLKRVADPNMLEESESTGRQQEQREPSKETDNSPSEELPITTEKEETEGSDHEGIDLQVKKLLEKYCHHPKIKHKSLKCLFTGPPRVGKTTLKKRLLKTIKNLITSGVVSPSGGLEKPISVIIGETRECVTVVMESDLDWRCQHDLLDEAQIVLEFIDKSHQSLPISRPTTVLPKPVSLTPFPATAMLAPATPVATTAVSSEPGPDSPTPRGDEADTLHDAKKLMQEVLSSRKLCSISDTEKTTTLYFMDTGGQPEFHEIMPIILNGPALHLIFFNLAFDLDEPIPIQFCHQDDTDSTITYVSSYTGKQMIFQLLSSLYYFSKSLSLDSEPAAVLIGTHLDQLKGKDEMKINDSLSRLLNNVEFHDRGFLIYLTKAKSTMFTPVNNYSGDEEEIYQLQAFLTQIVDDRFNPVELPSSWLFFHLLLRHRYENSPGVCKLAECRALARGCGLDEDDVPHVLRYIHQHLGTILFYEDVSGLNDIVICDPNVLFKAIYQLVAVSFGGEKGYHTIAAEIRKTGEIHARVLKRISTQSSSSLLKNEHIIGLLMHFKILTEVPSNDGVIYFMPCLLHPNNSLELSIEALQTLYPPPLLVRFKGNYIPMGVFSALVVKLLESSWEPDQDIRYRNHIVFNMDDDFSVELIVHPAYLEFRIRIANPTGEDPEEIHQFCMKVCKTVVGTLISVLDLHTHTKKAKFQLGFYCSGSFQADSQPHFCRLSHQRKINPKTFASSDSPHCQDQCRLPPETTVWLEQWKNKKDARDQSHASASTLTLKEIQNELKEITAAKWYQLGVQLEIPTAKLSTIESDHPRDAQRCMTEVMYWWLQNAPECSWAKLAEAVEAMGGYAVLAKKIKQKMSKTVKSGNKED